MPDTEKETCQNCAIMEGCIKRDLTIHQLFIVTGRDQEVPWAKAKLDLRPTCQDWRKKEE